MNYFDPKEAALRYSKGRPYFHANTIKIVAEKIGIQTKVENALDIACGTGLSSTALLDISKNVYGTDLSDEMLKNALNSNKINYRKSSADKQPFENEYFDIITVASGVHWFDINNFLTEANRLLKKGAWLVIYDNFFISEMEGETGFDHWYPEYFKVKFPAPKRNDSYDWTASNLSHWGFNNYSEQTFKNPISFNKESLILYLTTQSNITAQIENGNTSYQEVENWLNTELSAFFKDEFECKNIYFGNWVKYLQKN